MMTTGYLISFWEQEASTHYYKNVGYKATAAEVREFMLHYLDGEPVTATIARKFWNPLTTEEKQGVLLKAFPDGEVYEKPPGQQSDNP